MTTSGIWQDLSIPFTPEFLDPIHPSQHKPSLLTLIEQVPFIRILSQLPRWNFRKANWEIFQ